jgi:hypothetical protein
MPRNIARSRVLFIPLLGALIAVAACANAGGDRAGAGQSAGADPSASADGSAGAGQRAATDKAAGKDKASTDEGAAAGEQASQGASVVVNGQALSAETLQQLQQVYGAIAPGRYWYDAISGAYGREGQPIAGQMLAGLALGGRLRSDASRGTSGVYINGRQITEGEKIYLERLCQTPVIPGRYWIMANGIGGYEGAPASFNLGQCPGLAQQSRGPRSSSRTYCDANGACTTSGILGSILTAPN